MAIETPNVINALGQFDTTGAGSIVGAAGFNEASFIRNGVGDFSIDLQNQTGVEIFGIAFGTGVSNGEITLTSATVNVLLFDSAGLAVDGVCYLQVLELPNKA